MKLELTSMDIRGKMSCTALNCSEILDYALPSSQSTTRAMHTIESSTSHQLGWSLGDSRIEECDRINHRTTTRVINGGH